MSVGRCLRCGRVGPVEADHPDGREGGVPVLDRVVALLCPPCHVTKGRMDRAAGVEGGLTTLRRVLGRRAAWCAFLASHGAPLLMPAGVLDDCAGVLAAVARQVPPDVLFEVDP